MSSSRSIEWAPRGRARTRRSFHEIVHPGNALSLAVAAWLLVTVGDLLTTAEVGFTLAYLLPLGIAVWWRDLRSGVLLTVLCTASFVAADLAEHPGRTTPPGLLILAWNVVGQLGVFLAFAVVLDKLRKRLAIEVRERTSAVEQLRHADRLNTVGKLASGIAHELGTPLNVIHGRASMIASERTKGEDTIKSAKVIVQQTERMTTIIQNLLTFARRGGSRRTALDLSRLVRETVTLLDPLAKKRRVRLEVENGEPHVAPINAGELQQVLTNLIMNATQAMPDGGTVHVRLARGRPAEAKRLGLDAGDYVEIRVRDEGTGIAPDVLPHVFDPFFTTKEVGAGTGLGLSVAFGIVRDHGGTIDVVTELGKGSEFVVFLPQSEG